jgi:hypothetical protein
VNSDDQPPRPREHRQFAPDRALVRLKLELDGISLEAEIRVPVRRMRPVDLLPILMSMDDAVMGIIEQGAIHEGKSISAVGVGPGVGALLS